MLLIHFARGDFACLKLSLLFVMQPRLFTFNITKRFTLSCFLEIQTFSLIPQWSSHTQKGCCHFVSFQDQCTPSTAQEPILVSVENTGVSLGFHVEGWSANRLHCGLSESHSEHSGSQEELWQPQDFGFRSGSGHMLLGAKWHPTLLERHGVRGQLHQYNLPDPTPWPLERSVSLMYFGHWYASNSCMCHIYTMTVDRDKGNNTFLNVCKTRGWLAQANPFFDASGEEAESPLYCWEMDGSRTCRGLLLAPRQSYQLRLNLSFWLL